MPSKTLVARFNDVLYAEQNLSFQEKQLQKEEAYAEIAARRLKELKRRHQYAWVQPLIAALLLAGGAIWSLLAVPGFDDLSGVPRDRAIPLFILFTLALGGLGQLWKLKRVERKRLLYELVVEDAAAVPS